MPNEDRQVIAASNAPLQPTQGTLLGIVLDLSGSMMTNLKNNDGGQYARIESLSKSFQRVVEDVEKLLENKSMNDQMPLHLFTYGFGLRDCGHSICDILASINNIDKKIAHYRPLQSELTENWLFEVTRILEAKRPPGNAKESLRLFVEKELRDKAIVAEQKRNTAKLHRWCEATYFKFDQFETRLRRQLVQSRYLFILTPLIISLLWLLRLPTLIVSYFNKLFENWVQKKLKDIRINANKYATMLADRVVTQTEKAIDAHQQEIYAIIRDGMVDYIDRQAFHLIQLYNNQSSLELLNWSEFQSVYNQVASKIESSIRPHAHRVWRRNIFILKRAARVLRMTPNWNVLRTKSIKCAHQAIWTTIEPFVHHTAEELAKQRFKRAVISTIVQDTEHNEITFPLEDLPKIIQYCRESNLSINELPIFGRSPMGETLARVSNRFRKEMRLPKNRKLHPVLLIVSDGLPNGRVDPALIAENLKTLGITIICCYVTNKNLGNSWVLRRRPKWYWPNDAKLMFSMASSVSEWPQFGERLKDSRFLVKRNAKLFVQINHSEYLENFINAVLLPLKREHRCIEIQTGDTV